MVLAPDVDVRVLVDGGAVRKRLGVQIGDHRTRLGAHDLTLVVAEGDALDSRKIVGAALDQVRDELLERELTFTEDHHIGAAREVLVQVVDRVGSADHHQAASLLRDVHHLEDFGARHEVAVHAHYRRADLAQVSLQLVEAGERRIEERGVDAACFEVRADVQKPQRRIGLHHRQLVWILVQKVAVCEEDVHLLGSSLDRHQVHQTLVWCARPPLQLQSQQRQDQLRVRDRLHQAHVPPLQPSRAQG